MKKATQHNDRSAEALPPRLVPNDHVRLLVELLRPVGPELARRWLAALLIVHQKDREEVVSAVERELARLYPLDEHDRRAGEVVAVSAKSSRRSA